MKMARPTERDFELVIQFFSAIEEFFEHGAITNKVGDEIEMNDEEFVRHMHRLWGYRFGAAKVDAAWRRVVCGGQVAIENACDSTLPHLDFKPEIKTAVESYTAARDDG